MAGFYSVTASLPLSPESPLLSVALAASDIIIIVSGEEVGLHSGINLKQNANLYL